MKKLFTAVVALVICLSLTLTSFAAVTIGGTFTDGTDVYVYGSYEGDADEVGVKVGEKNYPLSETKMFQANKFGKFIIGLKDAMNLLGLEFDVAPYTVSGETEEAGEAVKAEKEALDSITAVAVGGKMVSGFFSGSEETEYYYGLEEIPADASALPAVSVKAGSHAFELKTEEEFGGWAVSAYHKNEKLVTVHFRKFAEFTKTFDPIRHYHARHHYVDVNMSSDINAKTAQAFYVRTKGDSIYDDTESTLGYTYYDVEAVEGYAPVSYTVSSVYVNKKEECPDGISLWSYDGDLSDETFTSIEDIKAAYAANTTYHNPVIYFKGFNPIEEYKIAQVSTMNQSVISFDSTTVKEGGNFIIMKNDTPNNTYSSFYYAANYPWKMTVKYVEKNPVDTSLTDTSLAEIKVGGKSISGVSSEVKDYYFGVENIYGELPEVTAVPTQAAKGAIVSVEKDIETKLTVTAADGVTTETYTLNFRPAKTMEISLSAATRSDGAWKSINDKAANYALSAVTEVLKGTAAKSNGVYLLYNVKLPEETVMTGAILNGGFKGATAGIECGIQVYPFAETETRTTDSWVDETTGKFKTNINPNYFAGLEDGDASNAMGELTFTGTSAFVRYDIELDMEKLNISPNGNVILIPKKVYSEALKTGYIDTPVLKINYVEKVFKDARNSDASLSSIKINGEEIKGFSSDVTEYYYPVESLDAIPEDIVAYATYEDRGAYGEIVEFDDTEMKLTVSGTSADGEETKDYYIYFREIKVKEVAISSAIRSQAIWSSLNTTQTYYNIDAKEPVLKGTTANNSMAAYLLFNPALGNNAEITSAELDVKIKSLVDDSTIEFYGFDESGNLKIDDWVNPETSAFKTKKSYFPGLDDTSDIWLLGSTLAKFTGSYENYTLTLKTDKLTVSPNGYSIIIVKKKYIEGSTTNGNQAYVTTPVLRVRYYEKG